MSEVETAARETGSATVSRHRSDIQGLRAVAVLLVVLFHADLGFSGGFVGVDVFFVISGFVITGMLMPELDGTGGIALRRFYTRRLKRLVPALSVMVIVTALVGILAAPIGIQQTAAHTGGAASLFLGNAYLYLVPKGYFAASSDLNPFLHTWSLAVEEQFYLVFPLVLIGSWRLAAKRRLPTHRTAVTALSLVAVVSFFLGWAMANGSLKVPAVSSPVVFSFYASPTRAWEFAAGALLAFAVKRLDHIRPSTALVAGSLGLLTVIVVSLRFDGLTLFPGPATLVPVLGTILILGAGVGGTRGVGRILSVRPLVFLGDLSYSWYLWHWPAIVYARAMWPGSFSAPLAAALALIPAWLSYQFVENPIRFNQNLTPRLTARLAIGAVAVTLVACLALDVGGRELKRTPEARQVALVSATHETCPKGAPGEAARATAAKVTDGDADDGTGALAGRRCTWEVKNPRATVALAGDSNARHFVEGLAKSTREQQESLYVATANGCPFADVTMVFHGIHRTDCRNFFLGSIRAVEKLHPRVVIIGSSSTRYVDEKQFGVIVGASGPTASTKSAKLAAWSQGLRRVLARLSGDGIETMVIHPVPKFPGWDVRGCAALRVVTREFSCGRSVSRAAEVASRQRLIDAEKAAAAGIPESRTVDFLDDLCTSNTCSTSRANVWMYHDGDHLSTAGSLELAPVFTNLLRSVPVRALSH